MAFRLAHRKTHGNLVEKWRIRCRDLLSGKVITDVKVQFVTPDRHRPVINQRLIGTTIRIGDRAGNDATCTAVR